MDGVLPDRSNLIHCIARERKGSARNDLSMSQISDKYQSTGSPLSSRLPLVQ